jgi:hypothetical protein
MVAGHPYLAINMRRDGTRFAEHRVGAMSCFGADVPRDRRFLIGFVRDISLVSEEEYSGLRPPQKLERFPEDLLHRDLEYSGLFEDGYLGETAFCALARPEQPATVAVRGEVPNVGDPAFTSELQLLVEGREVARRVLAVGSFEVLAPIPAGVGRSRIDLRFSAVQRLPLPDGRVAAVRLSSIGFEDRASTPASQQDQSASMKVPCVETNGVAANPAHEESDR